MVMLEIGNRMNNEFSTRYQRYLHSPEGAKNNGIGARTGAVDSLQNQAEDHRIEAVLTIDRYRNR
jgi:hypothetical protein